jgi:hypothetical protein
MPEERNEPTVDKSQDTRGPVEKLSDLLTNDRVDDKTGKVIREEGPGGHVLGSDVKTADQVAFDPDDAVRRNDWIDTETDLDREPSFADFSLPHAYEPSDEEDALERAADALTGDDIDDPVPRRREL